MTYQWFKNGEEILGKTNAVLQLSKVQFVDEGVYSVRVSNPLGMVYSANATLTVNPAGVTLGLYPGLKIEGVVGESYTIQYASELSKATSWTTITTIKLDQPIQMWYDASDDLDSPQNARKYYRVILSQ